MGGGRQRCLAVHSFCRAIHAKNSVKESPCARSGDMLCYTCNSKGCFRGTRRPTHQAGSPGFRILAEQESGNGELRTGTCSAHFLEVVLLCCSKKLCQRQLSLFCNHHPVNAMCALF